MSVAARNSSAAAAASRSRRNAIVASIPSAACEAQLERVGGVEQVLLVLLHVLVVGERQAVHHAVQPDQVRGQPRRLGPQQLGGVGVLLLGHDRRARGPGVGDLAEPELLAGPQHDLGAEPRQVRRAGGRRGQVVEHEVTVGDRVDRVRGHAREAQLARHRPRSVSKLTPASAPAPSGSGPVAAFTAIEAVAVADQHPEVREQVVAEIHRLCALEVRVAGHRPVQVAPRPGSSSVRRRASRSARPPGRRASRTNIATSVAT